MREIKFKAFIKKLGWLVPVDRINFDCETVEADLSGEGDTAEYNFDEIELVEYTGKFTDKRTCIFEGDIFMCNNDLVVIRWAGHGFYPFRRKNSAEFNKVTNWGMVVKSEPIGNIHKNPEILTT